MDECENKRGHREIFVRGKHLKLTELKKELQHTGKDNNYIFKENIPLYPRPEFHVSHLSRDTNALFEIVHSEYDSGFHAPSWEDPDGQRDPKDPHRKDLLWWSLSVQYGDMHSAEERLLDRTFPDRTEEQKAEQKGFLTKFATSPVFLDTSRYGSFRFTFPLEELLGLYRKQVCCGKEPVLRVYETVMYKQEVMYSVLVHSDHYNNHFKEYSLLDDSPDAVCAYKDGQIIWRPEAMCETHSHQLVPTPQKTLVAHTRRRDQHQFYVWDHVAVAFHLPEGQTLDIDTWRMRCNLKFCEPGQPTVSPLVQFHDLESAKELVEVYWPQPGILAATPQRRGERPVLFSPQSLGKLPTPAAGPGPGSNGCSPSQRRGERPLEVNPGASVSVRRGVSSSPDTVQTLSVVTNAVTVNSVPRFSGTPAKLAVYNRGCKQPQFLLIGDSMVRFLEPPNGITYCLPGAKVLDLAEIIPSISNHHPTAHTIIVHVGTNDIRLRQSTKLHQDCELLSLTIKNLGKTCIFSGPIPTPRKNGENFSRLYALHCWLINFCTVEGHGFISNFDYFWTRRDLYKPDNLHLNNKGTSVLLSNIRTQLQSP